MHGPSWASNRLNRECVCCSLLVLLLAVGGLCYSFVASFLWVRDVRLRHPEHLTLICAVSLVAGLLLVATLLFVALLYCLRRKAFTEAERSQQPGGVEYSDYDERVKQRRAARARARRGARRRKRGAAKAACAPKFRARSARSSGTSAARHAQLETTPHLAATAVKRARPSRMASGTDSERPSLYRPALPTGTFTATGRGAALLHHLARVLGVRLSVEHTSIGAARDSWANHFAAAAWASSGGAREEGERSLNAAALAAVAPPAVGAAVPPVAAAAVAA